MGITHFEDAPRVEFEIGHLGGRWTFLGQGAGSLGVGLSRIELSPGAWSTPAHEHGRQEEIFYVLSGRGISWQDGRTAEVAAGDCIVYLARGGAHTLHALEHLDVLAYGPRSVDEAPGYPRIGLSKVGGRATETLDPTVGGAPLQFAREAELGPPELPPEPGERPDTIVNLDAVKAERLERRRVVRTRRNLGRAAGSVSTGLQHVEVEPGKEATAKHCHSLEEELFVILRGEGVFVLGDDESPVRRGQVIACAPGTGRAHVFRAGDAGLTYLAYGTREPGDICYYPRSNKIALRGIGVIARLERLDYWDGED